MRDDQVLPSYQPRRTDFTRSNVTWLSARSLAAARTKHRGGDPVGEAFRELVQVSNHRLMKICPFWGDVRLANRESPFLRGGKETRLLPRDITLGDLRRISSIPASDSRGQT